MLLRAKTAVAWLICAAALLCAGCACFRPTSPDYNSKQCVVERQAIDCAKGSGMSLLPLVPSILIALVTGQPVDWVAIGMSAGKNGLQAVACLAAAIEADFTAPKPTTARYGLAPDVVSIIRERAHLGVTLAIHAAFGPGPLAVRVALADGSIATVAVK